jgi:hypothetical protein
LDAAVATVTADRAIGGCCGAIDTVATGATGTGVTAVAAVSAVAVGATGGAASLATLTTGRAGTAIAAKAAGYTVPGRGLSCTANSTRTAAAGVTAVTRDTDRRRPTSAAVTAPPAGALPLDSCAFAAAVHTRRAITFTNLASMDEE